MMPLPTNTDSSPESETPAPEGDQASGYTMCLSCLDDGTYAFHVEPLESAEEESGETAGEPSGMPTGGADAGEGSVGKAGEDAQSVDSLEAGLKLMVKYAHAHPMDGSQQTQFEAGFKSQRSSTTQEGA